MGFAIFVCGGARRLQFKRRLNKVGSLRNKVEEGRGQRWVKHVGVLRGVVLSESTLFQKPTLFHKRPRR